MTFSDANFEYNSDVFKPGEPFKLYADSVKTYFDLNPEGILRIVGHTDSIASADYNLDLGMRRAQSARDYFRGLGIEAKIVVESQGEERPVAPNSNPDGSDNPEGRQKNRRVNFILNTAEEYQNALEENKKILEDAADLN
ncbi:MAG: OmpA family protein [Lewinellaceae bacterium]|nr:OmpA family protein [Lewinellaceae bacterium]